jgi:hypothetical protein
VQTILNINANNTQSGNPASHVLDNDFDTRWSSSLSGVQLEIELQSSTYISSVEIAFFVGDTRQAYFELETSSDGITWVHHGSFSSSGTSLDLQAFNISPTQAQYVRFTGFGNSSNGWNSLTELKILGQDQLAPSSNPAKLHMELLDEVTETWQKVYFPERYTSPVIITTPIYTEVATPVVTRIRNVNNDSFEVCIQRADAINADPGTYQVNYLVAEEGVYTVDEHGFNMEVFKYDSSLTSHRASWTPEAISVSNSYSKPLIYGQVMSYNDLNWSSFWSSTSNRLNPITADSINIGLNVGEDPVITRESETLGCILVEEGTYTMNDKAFNFMGGADIIVGMQDGAKSYTTDGDLAIATLSAMDGNNGGWAVLYASEKPLESSLELVIDEDTFNDGERSHTTEQVNIIILKELN